MESAFKKLFIKWIILYVGKKDSSFSKNCEQLEAKSAWLTC